MEAHILVKYLIKHLVYIDEALIEFWDIIANFGFGDEYFISDFLVTFGKDEGWVFFNFSIELFDDLGLVEIGGLWFIENGSFLSFFNENSFQVIEPLSNDFTMGKME